MCVCVPCGLSPLDQPQRSQSPHPIICFSKADRWREGEKTKSEVERGRVGDGKREGERERGSLSLHRGELIRMKKKWREERVSSLLRSGVRRVVSQLVKVPNRACGHTESERARKSDREGAQKPK